MCCIKSVTNLDWKGPLESPGPTSSLKQGQLYHIIQGPELKRSEYLHGWRYRGIAGLPALMTDCPHSHWNFSLLFGFMCLLLPHCTPLGKGGSISLNPTIKEM